MGMRKKGEGINKADSLTFFIVHKQTIRFPTKGKATPMKKYHVILGQVSYNTLQSIT